MAHGNVTRAALFSVRLGAGELLCLRELRSELGLRSVGQVVRALVGAARTLFGLPPYMAERLAREMQERRLGFFAYVQEVLARHYEELESSASIVTSQEQNP